MRSELLLPACCSLGAEYKICNILIRKSTFCKSLNLLRKHLSIALAVQKTAAFWVKILK